MLLILPYKTIKAAEFVTPYRAALAVIRASRADIVIVESDGMLFGEDLVRNDPFLRETPKIMSLRVMSLSQVAAACRGFRVGVFDAVAAHRLGIGPATPPPAVAAETQGKLRLMAARRCGSPIEMGAGS